jgi:hypothetical protein
VLLLLVIYLCVHTMPRAWRGLTTDFQNYYLGARLAHEGVDTARMNEWIWLQREKDHRAIDSRLIGMVPITPFSTLAMWPLTGMQALTAKRLWILLCLALLIPMGWMLRSMTGLSYQRIALVFALSFPLHRNLLFGQYYVLLLLLIVAGCWMWSRERYVLAGGLIALAAAMKIFPVVLFIFFLRRRSWRALIAGAITGAAALAGSVAVFGWNLHRTYLHEVLPWTLHGEALPPYAISSASISNLLHALLLAEPQWNPHPWHSSVPWFAWLAPTLPMLVLAPAILLIRRGDRSRERVLREWSALLTAALAISTSAASYNFVLMALPVCVLAAQLIERRRYGWLAAMAVAYCGIGFPMPSPARPMGLEVLLYVPRLWLMLALLAAMYVWMWREGRDKRTSQEWEQYAWAAGIAAYALLSVAPTLQRERGMRQEFAYRLPLHTEALLQAEPKADGGVIRSIALTPSGYHLAIVGEDATPTEPAVDPSADDDLSFTSRGGRVWVERGLSSRSVVIDLREPSRVVVNDARDPMLSADAKSLAFVRDALGRGQLMLRTDFEPGDATEVALTSQSLNVYEASFLSPRQYAFSAVEDGRPPQIYLTDATHANAALELGESRYPALSPDGRWLAYSHFAHGVWNLWIRNQQSGAMRRVAAAEVPCNQIQPSWADAKTLLYGTDCGRGLWFTAIARRRAIP